MSDPSLRLRAGLPCTHWRWGEGWFLERRPQSIGTIKGRMLGGLLLFSAGACSLASPLPSRHPPACFKSHSHAAFSPTVLALSTDLLRAPVVTGLKCCASSTVAFPGTKWEGVLMSLHCKRKVLFVTCPGSHQLCVCICKWWEWRYILGSEDEVWSRASSAGPSLSSQLVFVERTSKTSRGLEPAPGLLRRLGLRSAPVGSILFCCALPSPHREI